MEKFGLKLTAAVVLDGEIRTAGSIVQVNREVAQNLLHRGRAEVATEADEAPAQAPEPEAEVAAEVKPVAKKKAK